MKKTKVLYAVPFAYAPDLDYDGDSIFFITFNTRDENEAIKLAHCICGKKAEKVLVILNEYGEIFPL